VLAIHQRHVGLIQVVRSHFDRLIDRSWPPIDQGIGILVFGGVVQEPGFAKNTGPLGLVNPHIICVQFNVVANAATEGACRMLDDSQVHDGFPAEDGWMW
jgi:hypothetical protein